MKKYFLLFLLTIATFVHADTLETIFRSPPDEAKPRAMWMWMGSQVSKTQITRDLEAMKDAGLGGTLMFSLADSTTPWPCPIENHPGPDIVAFTEPWWDMVRHAASESKRLGLDFGMASSPGYSSSGGPWITPEFSMLQVCFSETPAKGGAKVALNLPQPTVDTHADMKYPVWNPASGKADKPEISARKTYYKDIAILAMPPSGIVAKDQVIDLTGKTEWEAPAGEWKIYRFGYTTKGILLQPPQWEANGLEVDKLNPEAVAFHMNHVIGEIKSHLGPLVGNGFTFVHIDSYEAGVPDWTPKMREEFAKRRGYDMTPFLAKWAKRVIKDDQEMKKFDNDYKETIRVLFRDNYYSIAQSTLRDAGLTFSSEPYGGLWRTEDVLPRTDRVMTEFWKRDGKFNAFHNPQVVQWMHEQGRNLIEAEAFTASPAESMWNETPAILKPIGDSAFCAGVNRFVVHRMASQPWDDRFKPGNTMGQWGTHFDRTQTWWEPGKAMFRYWQRCQALLQWGKFAPIGFTAENAKVQAIHRQSTDGELWFIANIEPAACKANCSFDVTDKQPELWDPITGVIRDLPEFTQKEGKTIIPLDFAAGQSWFIVFRKPIMSTKGKNFPSLQSVSTINTPWTVQFDPAWGGPASVRFDALEDWTKRPEQGIKYYSGTATYRTTFSGRSASVLDLGVVNCIARVRINRRDLGVVWSAPWRVHIPTDLLKDNDNELEIEVTNVWANRLIGDEQEPPDCQWLPGHQKHGQYLKSFPEWFVKNQPRPSKGRYCFTTWNYFTKTSPLIPSGLIGPVQLMSEN